jgi:hypothetical protein
MVFGLFTTNFHQLECQIFLHSNNIQLSVNIFVIGVCQNIVSFVRLGLELLASV